MEIGRISFFTIVLIDLLCDSSRYFFIFNFGNDKIVVGVYNKIVANIVFVQLVSHVNIYKMLQRGLSKKVVDFFGYLCYYKIMKDHK